MNARQFRDYQAELGVNHPQTARLLKLSRIGVARFATGGRPIPPYVAQALRAMVLLHRAGQLSELEKLP